MKDKLISFDPGAFHGRLKASLYQYYTTLKKKKQSSRIKYPQKLQDISEAVLHMAEASVPKCKEVCYRVRMTI